MKIIFALSVGKIDCYVAKYVNRKELLAFPLSRKANLLFSFCKTLIHSLYVINMCSKSIVLHANNFWPCKLLKFSVLYIPVMLSCSCQKYYLINFKIRSCTKHPIYFDVCNLGNWKKFLLLLLGNLTICDSVGNT
jgi:hypothetical protein